MKLLLIILLSVLSVFAVSCAEFKPENVSNNQRVSPLSSQFDQIANVTFSNEDASKQSFLNVTGNANLVIVESYNQDADGVITNPVVWSYKCESACTTDVAEDKTYKVISINNNKNEITVTTIDSKGNLPDVTERFLLVR